MAVRVSVIIPVYNSVNYVGEAIRSVQEQSLDRDAIEILAVDDGSTDGGGELLAEMAAEDPRIRLLTQENSGTPGGARNPAIDIARGEFVFFLDSDDTLTPDALHNMLRMADAEDSDVVLGKLGSLDARAAPASMFKRTVADADLVEDNIFNTLALEADPPVPIDELSCASHGSEGRRGPAVHGRRLSERPEGVHPRRPRLLHDPPARRRHEHDQHRATAEDHLRTACASPGRSSVHRAGERRDNLRAPSAGRWGGP